MAWIDDRIWCHPKLARVGKPARWSFIASLAYSTGFHRQGTLTAGELRTIGATAKERTELTAAGLWHQLADGGITINDWDEHNSQRDAKRANDRERKRRERARKSEDVTRDKGVTNSVTSTVTARHEGSEGSDGSDFELPAFVQKAEPLTLPSREGLPFTQALEHPTPDQRDPFDVPGLLLDMLPDADQGTEVVLRSFRLPEYAYRQAIEAVSQRGGGVKLAVTVLKRVEAELLEQQAAGTNGNHAKDAWLDTLPEPE